jgi:hypothetical protein
MAPESLFEPMPDPVPDPLLIPLPVPDMPVPVVPDMPVPVPAPPVDDDPLIPPVDPPVDPDDWASAGTAARAITVAAVLSNLYMVFSSYMAPKRRYGEVNRPFFDMFPDK